MVLKVLRDVYGEKSRRVRCQLEAQIKNETMRRSAGILQYQEFEMRVSIFSIAR